jgi:hypothetical protein
MEETSLILPDDLQERFRLGVEKRLKRRSSRLSAPVSNKTLSRWYYTTRVPLLPHQFSHFGVSKVSDVFERPRNALAECAVMLYSGATIRIDVTVHIPLPGVEFSRALAFAVVE